MTASEPTIFDYTEHSPNLWSSALDEMKRNGQEAVRVTVPWGAHETLRGVRDFTKSSRLRTERVFALAAERSMKVSLHIGLSSSRSFPQWVSEIEKTALVSTARLAPGAGVYFQTEFPSLEHPELRHHFLEFVGEVLGIAQLYAESRGPLVDIELDLSLYEDNASLQRDPLFVECLAERYGDIGKLNSLFRATFPEFSAAISEQGLRICGERRAWLAAYDYRYCSRRMMEILEAEVRALPSAKAMERPILFRTSSLPSPRGRGRFLVDTTLVSLSGNRAFPYAPTGFPSAVAVLAYRLVDSLLERHKSSCEVLPFDPICPQITDASNVCSVVCSQYLSRAQKKALDDLASEGTLVLFPFGFPPYDENMSGYSWRYQRVQANGSVFLKNDFAKGAFLCPAEAVGYAENLWEDVALLEQALRQT